MAVTDLTGTKWYFNTTVYQLSTALNLNFYSNGLMYDQIYFPSSSVMSYHSADDSNPNSKVIDDGWTDQAYRFIGITGGTDATSQTVISWLQSNATLLPVINLTGTTWLFNDDLGYIQDDFLDCALNFTSNHTDFNTFLVSGEVVTYMSRHGTSIVEQLVYDVHGGWLDGAYRTIEITGGADVTNLDLIVWLTQNATYQGTSNALQSYQLCLKQPLGAYTLTWDSGITVMVSGSLVSQGYELQDGDIIQATVDSSLGTVYAVINSITYNAPADVSLYDTNIHISYYLQGSGGSVN